MDFDRYVTVATIQDMETYLKDPSVKGVVFSFGWTFEYKDLFTLVNKVEREDMFLTTITRLKKGLK